jgi:hypothetical protein
MSKKKKQNQSNERPNVTDWLIGIGVIIALLASTVFIHQTLVHLFTHPPDVRECIQKGHDYGSPIFEMTSIFELGAEEIVRGNLVRLCKRCDYRKTECNTVWGRCGWSVTESARKEQKDGDIFYYNCLITDHIYGGN